MTATLPTSHWTFELRSVSTLEQNLIDRGFDNLYHEAGITLESTKSFAVVVSLNGEFIGCAKGLIHLNGHEPSGWFHLSELFVLNKQRNQGLGSDLLLKLESALKKQSIEKIWLWTSGAESTRFYLRNRYETFKEMENWYSDGSSRIGMSKKL